MCDVPSTAVFVVNLSNVFPVQLPDFSLSFSLLFQWLQLLLVQPYISGSTFVVSLYTNACILSYYYHHHPHIHHCDNHEMLQDKLFVAAVFMHAAS